MARMAYSRSFLQELAELDEVVEREVWRKLELVEGLPGVGSSLLDPYLERQFGGGCLKVSAFRYDVIYERGDATEGEGELVRAHGIIHRRRVR